MKIKTLLALAWWFAWCIPFAEVQAQGTAFTYQGRLNDGAALANGSYDLRFAIFSVASGAGQIGPIQDRPAVPVSNGLFTVTLDFGPNFPGANRWLEVSVRPAGTAPPLPPPPFTKLTPRHALLPTPYAITAGGLSGPLPSGGLVGNYGNPISFTSELTASGGLRLNDGGLWLRGGSDTFHGLRYAGGGSPFAGQNPDGPVLFGWAGGVLGSIEGGTKAVLNWKSSGQVGIGTNNPRSALHVAGTVTATAFTGNWEEVAGAYVQAMPNRGYLATSESQVAIVLPATPAVADLVRVSGVGSGGWKILQNPGQTVRVGSIQLPGSIWTAREINRPWAGVASSADGTKLFAAHRELNWGAIHVSTDSGVTWSASQSPTNLFWKAIVCSANGSKVVALPNSGFIHTSSDSGTTWTPRINGRSWECVASSSDGSKLVAVELGDTVFEGRILTSSDSGVTWVPRDSNRRWTGVASSSDGNKLAAVTIGRIYTSIDSGVTWTARDTNRDWSGIASSADGGKLAAVVNGGQIYTSTDSGMSWTPRELNRNWLAVASSVDGSKLVAVANVGQIHTSTDSGVTWTARESERFWTGVASSFDGTKLVAVVGGGQIYTSSNKLTTTSGISGDSDAAVELQHIGGGVWRILSHVGAINWY